MRLNRECPGHCRVVGLLLSLRPSSGSSLEAKPQTLITHTHTHTQTGRNRKSSSRQIAENKAETAALGVITSLLYCCRLLFFFFAFICLRRHRNHCHRYHCKQISLSLFGAASTHKAHTHTDLKPPPPRGPSTRQRRPPQVQSPFNPSSGRVQQQQQQLAPFCISINCRNLATLTCTHHLFFLLNHHASFSSKS